MAGRTLPQSLPRECGPVTPGFVLWLAESFKAPAYGALSGQPQDTETHFGHIQEGRLLGSPVPPLLGPHRAPGQSVGSLASVQGTPP